MLDAIFFDSPLRDAARREQLYSGRLFVFSPRRSTLALVEFARSIIEEAFGSQDPRQAQFSMPVEDFVGICAPLKPRFIHHPRTLDLITAVTREFGCDLNDTYVDVPRLRMVTHGGYLTSGVGYAHHPHRDTWYAAPMCQLNWWLPIYSIEAESGMAFHPSYWNRAIKNGSARFNYYRWNAEGRKTAAQHITSDTRVQPRAEEPLELEPQTSMICAPGGIVLFSAAQLHSTVANTSGLTRFSIDFRTINLRDLLDRKGAPNIDSAPTGTSLRDFHRVSDLAPLPDAIVAKYECEPPQEGALIFKPDDQEEST